MIVVAARGSDMDAIWMDAQSACVSQRTKQAIRVPVAGQNVVCVCGPYCENYNTSLFHCIGFALDHGDEIRRQIRWPH